MLSSLPLYQMSTNLQVNLRSGITLHIQHYHPGVHQSSSQRMFKLTFSIQLANPSMPFILNSNTLELRNIVMMSPTERRNCTSSWSWISSRFETLEYYGTVTTVQASESEKWSKFIYKRQAVTMHIIL